MLAAAILMCCIGSALAGAAAADAQVLRVGTYGGIKGGYRTIQSALNAAKPGAWILVGPGDYKEAGALVPEGGDEAAGVLVTKPGVHIRGMNRNGVVIDGTKPKTPTCSSAAADQNLGPLDAEGHASGRNGVEVFKVAGVSVENLSACNFQSGYHGGGNEIWFNFGDGSGKQMAGAWRGAFLSATDQFYQEGSPYFGSYGIFVSNTGGPGLYTQVYANNMADSDFYIGACRDCNTILDHAHAETSALGYSGTNSGGHLTIQNSEFNNNKSGFVSNSQNNDDAPSPQDGSCPKEGETGPTGTHNCWLFTKNSVHDNNNPNVPTTGVAGAGPVGSGVVLAGDRNNIVSGNAIYNNGAWGVLLVPFPAVEEEPPPDLKEDNCLGGVKAELEGKTVCYYDDFGNEITNNTLSNNGFFGNPSNVDLAEISNLNDPGNCWHGSKDTGQLLEEPTSEPKFIQSSPHSECGIPDAGEPLTSSLGVQVACDSQFFGSLVECPTGTGANYPRRTKVEMEPLPEEATLPDPCAGVPQNPWCASNPKKQPPYPVPGSPAE